MIKRQIRTAYYEVNDLPNYEQACGSYVARKFTDYSDEIEMKIQQQKEEIPDKDPQANDKEQEQEGKPHTMNTDSNLNNLPQGTIFHKEQSNSHGKIRKDVTIRGGHK